MPEDPLLELIAGTLGLDPSAINEMSDTSNVRKWDSLRHIILMTELETQFRIELTDQEMMDSTSVAKIRALLRRKQI